MKINFPAAPSVHTPRIYLAHEVAALLVPLRYTESPTDYYLIDERFDVLDSHPRWNTLVVYDGTSVSSFGFNPEKLHQLYLSGTLTLDLEHPVLTQDILTPDMISEAIRRNESLKFETKTPRFQVPKSGAYFVRLHYSELGDAPNPELTHFAQFLDTTPVGIFRLIPGQNAELLQSFSPLEKEIVSMRQDDEITQANMDADSLALANEIRNTEYAIVNEHGLVFPRDFRAPVSWVGIGPQSWAYLRVTNDFESPVVTKVYEVTKEGYYGCASNATPDHYLKELRNLVINMADTPEKRDELVALSDLLEENDKNRIQITRFDLLETGDRFRLLQERTHIFEKTADNRAFADHGLKPYHTFAGAVLVIKEEGLDQTAPSPDNDTPEGQDPLDSLKNETRDDYKLLLLEDIQTSRKVAILGTDDTDKKLGYLVGQSFGYNWTVLKWNDIEPHTAEILIDAGWPVYELGTDYKDHENAIK